MSLWFWKEIRTMLWKGKREMNKQELRKHCEKQIELCIKLHNSNLKEYELILGLLNENESLINKNNKYKKAIDKFQKILEKHRLFCLSKFEKASGIDIVVYKYKIDKLDYMLNILKEVGNE